MLAKGVVSIQRILNNVKYDLRSVSARGLAAQKKNDKRLETCIVIRDFSKVYCLAGG